MAASVQFRAHDRDLRMVMREVDENLAIFLGIRNGEKDSDEFDISKEPKLDSFLNSKVDKISDCDWLHKHREISLLPSNAADGQDSKKNHTASSNDELISLKSELADNSSAAGKRRPSLSEERKPTARAATPTGGRPMKSRASTLTSSKPKSAQKRSSTPSRATSNSSNISANSKPAPRSATPNRKPAAPSTKSSASDFDRSSSGRKTGSTILKNPAPSNGASQTVRSRPSKPLEMLSLSHDATKIPKIICAPAAHSSSTIGKPRQKSCSPPKIRASNGNDVKNGIIVVSKSRGYSNGGDDVNPVVMGTKMVERVVNMRKLAPPKQDDYVSIDNPKKSSLEKSGFGRSLSKKSLDMAIRHMDIRRSISDNLRPIATVLSSSACGIQSSSSKSSTVGASESTLTSSSDSSKSSNGVISYFIDGRQMDD